NQGRRQTSLSKPQQVARLSADHSGAGGQVSGARPLVHAAGQAPLGSLSQSRGDSAVPGNLPATATRFPRHGPAGSGGEGAHSPEEFRRPASASGADGALLPAQFPRAHAPQANRFEEDKEAHAARVGMPETNLHPIFPKFALSLGM